jgi:hypothetical protein
MSSGHEGRERVLDATLGCLDPGCELPSGHGGPHLGIFDVAGLEDQDPRQIWQRWDTGEQAELVRLFPCDQWDVWPEASGSEDAEPCILPDGHDGPHRSGQGWWWADRPQDP